MVYGYKSEPITSMILKKLYHKEERGDDVQALRFKGRATSLLQKIIDLRDRDWFFNNM
jgi:hypothetical protein